MSRLAKPLMSRVQVGAPHECWPWSGAKSKGYGRVRVDGRVENAHRAVYMQEVGSVGPEQVIDHTCHNDADCFDGPNCPHKACCNPAHLEAVTQGENSRRGNDGRHNAIKTHCPSGHEYTPENTRIVNATKGKFRRCLTCHRGRR